MTPQEHADAIAAATHKLRTAVEKARRELPVGSAQTIVGAMSDLVADFYLEVEDLQEVLAR